MLHRIILVFLLPFLQIFLQMRCFHNLYNLLHQNLLQVHSHSHSYTYRLLLPHLSKIPLLRCFDNEKHLFRQMCLPQKTLQLN